MPNPGPPMRGSTLPSGPPTQPPPKPSGATRSALPYPPRSVPLNRTVARIDYEGAGMCPCCRRTFKQLAEHMKSKHPDFDPARPS